MLPLYGADGSQGPSGPPHPPGPMVGFHASMSSGSRQPEGDDTDRDASPERLERLFDAWMDTETKVRLARFYHDNPGVIETLEGLARRLGVSVRAIKRDVADHVRLGLLREVEAGGRKVLLFDRRAEREIESTLQNVLDKAMRGDA